MTTAALDSKFVQKYRQYRFLKDKVTTVTVTIGGLGVVGTLLLIFLYLMYEVIPLFKGAEITQISEYPLIQPEQKTVYLAMEEQAEVAFRLTENGDALFWKTHDGAIVKKLRLPLPSGTSITSFAESSAEGRLFIVGLSNGQALIAKHNYSISYPNDIRVITPELEYPYGEHPIDIAAEPLKGIAIRDDDELTTVAAVTATDSLKIIKFEKEEDFLTAEVKLSRKNIEVGFASANLSQLEIDSAQRWLFAVENSKRILAINLQGEIATVQSSSVLSDPNAQYTDLTFLLGGISLLSADTQGKITQWFMVKNGEGGASLQMVREFQHEPSISQASTTNSSSQASAAGQIQIAVEKRRKGFVAYDDSGNIAIYHTTSHRELLREKISQGAIIGATLSPRADALLVLNDKNQVAYWEVENEHPDVSWSALWDEIWYESYKEPDYIWQSSAANNDFEPKFSLTPLAFGTLKAAFYTMLLASPLAICGAIYTAYFMTPGLRRKVKPLIELMAALPTVILGFLAGIWLAPFVEVKLPGVIAILVFTPFVIVLTGYVWSFFPKPIRYFVPQGWEAAILIPSVLLSTWACIAGSGFLELTFFAGDMRGWMNDNLGLSYDQRNALIVGIAMGLAVIPTIFSITEDAIFSVPKHLSNGSLALGASPWQTLVGVVLPTASPGIFSAMMIGMGRAVGETMIVLMATGNTPIIDANIFEGMRTLSANIAVEVPEAEVNSTHFRVLYLSAFFLFLFTFVVNTVAEVVRQRLRKRYGTL